MKKTACSPSPLMLKASILIICTATYACMPQLPHTGDVRGPRTFRVPTEIRTGDFNRDYHIHIPPGYDGRQSLPMVVVIHGAFDTAKGMEKYSGFSTLADRENFIVLYPNGIGILGFLQHWNAGHCCGKAQQDKIDDVGFVASVIESAAQRFNVDRKRIFMLGFSNGGMLTYRFAAEKSELLAGAAALAASIGSRTPETQIEWQIPRPAEPVPLLIMHGAADTNVPYEGHASQRHDRYYRSVDESVGFWTSRNGCRQPEPLETLNNGAVSLTKWSNCTSGKPVWFYTIRNWEHIWPGKYFTAKLEADNPLKDFDASEIIWDFFKYVTKELGNPDDEPVPIQK
jgi:polyhydroxybutyrate depolymerase